MIAFLKKLFGYKLQVVPREKKDEGDDSLVNPEQEGEGASQETALDPKSEKKAAKAAKKAAKLEAKKAKQAAKAEKAKAKKAKAKPKAKPKPKPKKKKGDDEGGKSKLPIILGAAAVVVLGIGAGIYFVVFGGLFSSPTTEELLMMAREHTQQGEYESSMAIYEQLIEEYQPRIEYEEEETALQAHRVVVQSYLGLAHALVATDNESVAIERLQTGFDATQDEQIQAALRELSPELVPEPAVVEGAINWSDRDFERLIRQAIDRPYGDILPSDLDDITTLKILGENHVTTTSSGLNTLNFVDGFSFQGEFFSVRGNITHLDDVANFRNLRRLTIGYNSVRDIRGVAALPQLTMLGLYANDIQDISPLSGLDNLQQLFLYNNRISDLSPLRGLTNLREISLQFNEISDISALGGLSNLHQLFMSNNNISDLSPLYGLTYLAILGAQNNAITNISVVNSMTSLTGANFAGNPVQDMSPAANLSTFF